MLRPWVRRGDAAGRRRTVEVRREEILDRDPRAGRPRRPGGDPGRRRGAALGVSPALVFYHFGTKDALVAEAFAHAVRARPRPARRGRRRAGADPVDRLRRVLRLYGPTGTATGWRLWIDAWALAQREPEIRRVLRRLDQPLVRRAARGRRDGVADGVFRCPDPAATVARVSALLDGLSVATLVYRSVTRAQLRRWVAEAVARELGVDPRRCAESLEASRHTSQCGGVGGVGQRRPVQPERPSGRSSVAPSSDQVGEQPAEGRRELEAVRGAEPDHDRRVPGHRRDHEVAVRGQRVLAAQRPHRRGRCPGSIVRHVVGEPLLHRRGRARTCAASGSTTGPPQSWAALTVGSP